jgi:hypothetical protein
VAKRPFRMEFSLTVKVFHQLRIVHRDRTRKLWRYRESLSHIGVHLFMHKRRYFCAHATRQARGENCLLLALAPQTHRGQRGGVAVNGVLH